MSEGRRAEISSCCQSTALSLLYLVVMPTVWAHHPPSCAHEIFYFVKYILSDVNSLNSTEETLYTPNMTDYKKCPKSILTCFAEEMKVLVYYNPALRKLKLTERLRSIKTKEEKEHCPQCEVYKMESVETFLDMLKGILEQINDSCRPEP